ncbi:MAG TPA: hypothetical protein VMW38_03960 [Terriglobia bacterium]|nr:hypothetical protein [Terriglobia bacterium]
MIDFSYVPIEELNRFRSRAMAAGTIGILSIVAGAFINPAQFFHSYLLGYIFWLGLTVGCMAVLMLHHLSGGGWGIGIRRISEAATQTFPLLFLLFLPLLFGRRFLYAWTRPEDVVHSDLLQHKTAYLNLQFFSARLVIYFAVWIVLSHFLNKWSAEQDRNADPGITRRMQTLSGPGLVLFGLTVTFASIDWVMSLDPEWFSTMFGLAFMEGQALTGLAFVIAVSALLSQHQPLCRVISSEHFHDLGKLLLAFVMIWAYLAFSQFLIIWSGNLPEEIPWYVRRLQGGWQWVGLVLVLFHFALPFLLLLSRDLKRNARTLANVAWAVILMRLVDLFWLTAPQPGTGGFRVHWMDLAAPVGIGGLWLAIFFGRLVRRPLLALNDPEFKEILAHAGESH